jgi:hypothetical protein
MLTVSAIAAENVIIEPDSYNSSQALLIIAPTKGSAPEDYEQLAKRLQLQSSFSLWIGIINFTENLPSAHKFAPAVKSIIKQVNEKISTPLINKQIFIAAHGHGGFSAIKYSANSRFGGLILLASYLPEKETSLAHRLPNFPIPVLTLGGDLDGIIKLPLLSREFSKFQILRGENKNRSTKRKPVIVLRGLNHHSFSNGRSDPNDIHPESYINSSHSDISSTVDSFMVVNTADWAGFSNSTINSKLNHITNRISYTEDLVNGYIVSLSSDQHLCALAQKYSSGYNYFLWKKTTISSYHHKKESTFSKKKPILTIKDLEVLLDIHYYVKPLINKNDLPVPNYSSTSVWCKMVNQDTLRQIHDIHPSTEERNCNDINQNTMDLAKSLLTYHQLKRFNNTGKSIFHEQDINLSTNSSWNSTPLKILKSTRGITVTSPTLRTNIDDPNHPGVKYCKLLTVSYALEWMLTDALKN